MRVTDLTHPDDRQRGDAEIQMALRGEKEFDTEFRALWPDGTIHYVRALALVQRDASGRATHMIGTNWDITAQRRAQAQIQQRNQALSDINVEQLRHNDELVGESAIKNINFADIHVAREKKPRE